MMIKFENINKSFGKSEVLQNISLNLEMGQSVAILGPNGSGKTTLIKSLLGMVIPDSGQILFDGKNIKNEFAYRSEIGYMPQIGNYPPNLKIAQLIDMMKDIRKGKKEGIIIDEEIIELFKLKKMYQKPLGTLSGGTKQKVSAALAFLFDPKVLILDEPTAGLDPLASELLKSKILEEKRKGKLIIITSHIMADLEELSTHVVYMQEGKLKIFKELEDLRLEYGEERLGKIIALLMKNNFSKIIA
ncbi:ABC transporter ATP-binding protein [Lacihabitans sp. CCS-44]|uniref:ABC transporter ATP-binding protein n=1 Tax=Lacihabitans sp. CCS-44 TaxID=2487331 RepID=UPI00286D7CD1|nr:ABC transporter ATP-binding protein [Lacihabitans sp. CCS-44]